MSTETFTLPINLKDLKVEGTIFLSETCTILPQNDRQDSLAQRVVEDC